MLYDQYNHSNYKWLMENNSVERVISIKAWSMNKNKNNDLVQFLIKTMSVS